ncbi:MAG TPA: Crp/Fnr family transcriptional regulator [Bryobacteraceae bacterium]|nr:Crp/Fnr family transcriptional regulator [Bryobacteraceae bacterium]
MTSMPSAGRNPLDGIPMFSGLAPEITAALTARASKHAFAPGEMLFREAERCEGIYILLSGSVKIFKTSPSGRQVTLTLETAPATLAELPLFDGGPFPASAQAVGEAVTVFIHQRDFRAICLQYPELPLRALAMVGRRLRTLVFLVESLAFGKIRQRLARMLLDLAATAGADSFLLPGTHQEIALNLGTVREVVSRNLTRFQAAGLIRTANREITICDREGLEREAEAEF